MGIDLSGLSNAANIITALSGLAIVTPKLKGYNAQKADGTLVQNPMLFHYETNNSITLTSDITDHAVEDNTVVNDQIAIKPEIVSVGGFIGELNNVLPEELQIAKEAKEKLLLISGYVPELTVAALRAFNIAEQGYRLASNLKDQFAEVFGGEELSQNEQQAFFQKFYSYFLSRTLFTIQTPWVILTDMAIQSFKANQGEESEQLSDYEITFKKIRFAATAYQERKVISGRGFGQSATSQNNGLKAGASTVKTFSGILA